MKAEPPLKRLGKRRRQWAWILVNSVTVGTVPASSAGQRRLDLKGKLKRKGMYKGKGRKFAFRRSAPLHNSSEISLVNGSESAPLLATHG